MLLKSLFITLFTLTLGYSQSNIPLYYFFNKTGTAVGVRDAEHKIIIPAEYAPLDINEVNEQSINGLYILLRSKKVKGFWPYLDAFYLFDRQGTIIANPLFYDNGMDYLQEGYFRFVEGSKIGFMDTKFQKAIPAQFDFVTPFSEGLAVFCQGCTAKAEGEAKLMTGGTYGVIDTKGTRIKEQLTEEQAYEYLNTASKSYFKFNAEEQKIQKALEENYKEALVKTFPQLKNQAKIYPKITPNAYYDASFYTFKLYIKVEDDYDEALNVSFLMNKTFNSIAYLEDDDVMNIKKKNLKFK